MSNRLKWRTLLIVLVLVTCVYLVITRSFNQGLDIQGGTHFTLEVITEKLNEADKLDAVEKAVMITRKRINEIGVAGTVVQKGEGNRFMVQIPGIESAEADRIRQILTRLAHLEFKLVIDGPGQPIVEPLDKNRRI